MTFREGTREIDAGTTAPGGLASPEEPEAPAALEEEAEETPRPAPLEAGAAPRGEDPVRLYLKEIGKVPLLTAAQEVQIGRRIEVGQIALRRTLAGMPLKPALVDDIVAQVRARWERINQLGEEARRNQPAAGRELRGLEKGVGLPRRQLSQLLEQIERSDRTVRQAKRELMEANLRLVVSVAKRYLGSDLSLLDLVQEGNIGLMKAVDRFQYRRGFKFSTYATWWIRQAITRAIA